MATQAEHLAQTRRNRDFAAQLLKDYPSDPTAMQWAVTAAFYCAVHCIEAPLTTFGTTTRSHEDRCRRMLDPRYNVSPQVYAAYRQLPRHRPEPWRGGHRCLPRPCRAGGLRLGPVGAGRSGPRPGSIRSAWVTNACAGATL